MSKLMEGRGLSARHRPPEADSGELGGPARLAGAI